MYRSKSLLFESLWLLLISFQFKPDTNTSPAGAPDEAVFPGCCYTKSCPPKTLSSSLQALKLPLQVQSPPKLLISVSHSTGKHTGVAVPCIENLRHHTCHRVDLKALLFFFLWEPSGVEGSGHLQDLLNACEGCALHRAGGRPFSHPQIFFMSNSALSQRQALFQAYSLLREAQQHR